MGCLRAYTCPKEDRAEKKQKRVAQLLNIKSKHHHPFTSTTAGTAIDPKSRRATVDAGRVELPYAAAEVELGEECTEGSASSTDSLEPTTACPNDAFSSDLSDTLASAASFSSTRSNYTEAPTPDESSGLSFEEDSQPIHSSFPGMLISNADDPFYAESATEGISEKVLPGSDPTAQYVSQFLDR